MDALTGRELVDQFIAEAIESLRDVPRLLDSFYHDTTQTEAIHAAFRVIHSIKGTAACLGLDAFKLFVHSLENLLAQVRDGKTHLSDTLLEVLIEGIDHLEGMLRSAADGVIVQHLGPAEQAWLARIQQPAPSETSPTSKEDRSQALQAILDEVRRLGGPDSAELARKIEALVLGAAGAPAPDPGAMASPKTVVATSHELEGPPSPRPKELTVGRYWCGHQDLTALVHTIAHFFLKANSHGVEKSALADFLPHFELFVHQVQTAGQKAIAQNLAGVLADLQNLYASAIELDAGLAELLWDRLGPELLQLQVPDSASDAPAPPHPGTQPTAKPAVSSPLSPGQNPNAETQGNREKESAPFEPIERPNRPVSSSDTTGEKTPCSAKIPSPDNGTASPNRYVRVKENYLEQFLEDVSHLFITGELLRELQTRMSEVRLGSSLAEEFHRTCHDLRIQLRSLHRSAASLRRVSAAELFAPYPRMARSLALQLKKKVRVLMEGEEIEIDRALARELEAPLTHLVRNAVDHGIDLPEERQKRGADPIGTLRLIAEQSRHDIYIRVEDDGQGIDPDRLRRKAVEKGLLTPWQAETLSDSDSVQLIFHPGFSTAEKVSEVSGRGVGMDVVRTVVEKYQGKVDVESAPGKGTKVQITFPIRPSVLVLEGLLIRQEGQPLVIPLEHVQEILQLQSARVSRVQNCPVLQFRGKCYTLMGVHQALEWTPSQPEIVDAGPAALVGPPGEEICLRFDELCGHRQVVVRSLEGILPDSTTIQGVALLGGGRLALVLNIPEILAHYHQNDSLAMPQ